VSNVGPYQSIKYVEDFHMPNYGSGVQGLDGGTLTANAIAWLQNIDTGDKAWARSFSAGLGIHLAGSLANTDNNMLEFCSDQLMFYGTAGYNMVEVQFQTDVATAIAFNFGFHDEVTEVSATLPVECSATSFASSASTYLGFVFDTDATNDDLHCFWVDDDNDATESIANLRMQGASLEANKWLYLRVEMQDRGSGNGVRATFHAQQDERTFEKVFNTTVDNDAALCWYFAVENRSAVARNVYLRCLGWEQTLKDDNT